jgi:SAM-dependent methyltransferase
MPAFDGAARSFDAHRALPAGVPEAIRGAILAGIGAAPRLLDLGAGTGRIGLPFVAAGDDYVGIDLSREMLRTFAAQAGRNGLASRLAQADGRRLPFRDQAFDVVLLVQVFGGLSGWRQLMDEVRRVLRPAGTVVIGRSTAPEDGLDARMRDRLALLLAEMAAPPAGANPRAEVERWLTTTCRVAAALRPAEWMAERSPRGFLDRHRGGARFSALPAAIKDEALRRLALWASETFGSLNATFLEPHGFEVRKFQFKDGRGAE